MPRGDTCLLVLFSMNGMMHLCCPIAKTESQRLSLTTRRFPLGNQIAIDEVGFDGSTVGGESILFG